MKVYSGWVIDIKGAEWVIGGSIKLRGKQYYIISNARGKQSIERSVFLSEFASGNIKYVCSRIVD